MDLKKIMVPFGRTLITKYEEIMLTSIRVEKVCPNKERKNKKKSKKIKKESRLKKQHRGVIDLGNVQGKTDKRQRNIFS